MSLPLGNSPLSKVTSAVPALLLLSLLLLPPLVSVSSAEIIKEQRTLMGTEIEFTVSTETKNREAAEEAFDAIEAEFERIESVMSEWKAETAISEINALAGKGTVEVTNELFMLLAVAKEIATLTGGAFDPTWAAMRTIWDFRAGSERVATKEEIAAALGLIDYRQILLDQEKMTVGLEKKGMALGLGGIAKGYAVDRAIEILVKAGIGNAIVKAGGDMRVQGERSPGNKWKVSIKHPRKKGNLATLPLKNLSISTSGDYERFFIKNATLYHHIIDPKTGYPASKCQSVTVLAPDTMTSDALSTAIFVLGAKKGLELARMLKGVEVIIVDSTGKVLTSKGIELH